MKIELTRAAMADAEKIHAMQLEAFKALLEKYQDLDTNPGNERVEDVRKRLEQSFTFYYFICVEGKMAGAVRIVDKGEGKKRVSPIFVLPQFNNRGIAQRALQLCEEIHGSGGWELETILQEPKNCHLYEKLGYHRTGKVREINKKLTLVYYSK